MYFEEERRVLQLGFDLRDDESNPGRLVSHLAEVVQLGCPTRLCLKRGIPARWDPELVGRCLEALSPDRVAVVLSSRDLATSARDDGSRERVERWFGTR